MQERYIPDNKTLITSDLNDKEGNVSEVTVLGVLKRECRTYHIGKIYKVIWIYNFNSR